MCFLCNKNGTFNVIKVSINKEKLYIDITKLIDICIINDDIKDGKLILNSPTHHKYVYICFHQIPNGHRHIFIYRMVFNDYDLGFQNVLLMW